MELLSISAVSLLAKTLIDPALNQGGLSTPGTPGYLPGYLELAHPSISSIDEARVR